MNDLCVWTLRFVDAYQFIKYYWAINVYSNVVYTFYHSNSTLYDKMMCFHQNKLGNNYFVWNVQREWKKKYFVHPKQVRDRLSDYEPLLKTRPCSRLLLIFKNILKKKRNYFLFNSFIYYSFNFKTTTCFSWCRLESSNLNLISYMWNIFENRMLRSFVFQFIHSGSVTCRTGSIN